MVTDAKLVRKTEDHAGLTFNEEISPPKAPKAPLMETKRAVPANFSEE